MATDLNTTQSTSTEEDEIDLRQYISIFLKYKWRILALTVLIGILAVVVSLSLTPIYQATATVLIESDNAKVVSIEEVYGISSGNKEYYETQLGVVKSRSLAEKLVQKLELHKHYEFDPTLEKKSPFGIKEALQSWIPSEWAKPKPELTPTDIINATVNAVMEKLSITLIRNSQLMEIKFESEDPKLAAAVPNALTEIYIDNDLEARLEMTRKAASWLTERLEGLRQKLSESEKSLQAYLESQNLLDVSGVKSVAASQLDEMGKSLVEARQSLSQAQVAYGQVKSLKGKPMSAYESVPEILVNPLFQKLKEIELDQENKVSELSNRYGSKHPSMLAAVSELDSAKRNTETQIRKVISSIEKNYQAAQSRLSILQGTMQTAEDKIQSISRKEYQLGVLERDVETNRQLYDLFLKRFKETDVSQTHQSTVARSIDPAIVPSEPSKPKKALIVMIATILGFLAATMLAFILEHLNNTIESAEDVEEKLGAVLLGVLPRIKGQKKKQKVEFMVLQDDKSQFAESIRTIRTGIMLSGLDNPHKVILITSSVPSEGKSTFSINQALALGQLKKTLLIDADLRRPSIGKSLGLNIKTPGLTELVAGEKTLNECIQRIDGLNVDILLSGMIPPNPLELLSSNHFRDTLSMLEQEYEQIVIDTAPAHAVSDALVLSSYAKALIYVVKADSTPYQLAQAGIKRLQQVKAPILGVVLNQFEPGKPSKYYGKYGYYYAKSYYGTYNYS